MNSEFNLKVDVDDLRSQFTSKLAYLLGSQQAYLEALDNCDPELFDFYILQLNKITSDIDTSLSDFNKKFNRLLW